MYIAPVGSGRGGRPAVGTRRRIVLAVVTIVAAGASCTESDPFESGVDPLIVDRAVSTTVDIATDDAGAGAGAGAELPTGDPPEGVSEPPPSEDLTSDDPASDDPASDDLTSDDLTSENPAGDNPAGDDSGPAPAPNTGSPRTNPGTTLPNGRSDQTGSPSTGTNTGPDPGSTTDPCGDSASSDDGIPDGPCVPGLPSTE
jgi:penicillin-binding protein 1A